MFWVSLLLAAVLLILIAAWYALSLQRRPSLENMIGELRNMRLEEEPRQVLGGVLRDLSEILRARRIILLFYDSEAEQLYCWNYRRRHVEPALSEVPPRELDSWITLERRDRRETLGPDAPLSQRLDAQQILSVRFARGAHCGRLLALDPEAARPDTLDDLQELTSQLAPLLEQFFTLRRVRALAIDEERRRIAHDFHDGPLQTFFSFDVHLEVVRKMLERDPQRAAQELEQLQTLVRAQGREMRELVQEMRPIDVEGTTLLALLRYLVEDLQKGGALSIKLLADSHRVDAPRRVAREVYQIVREAVTNARKHARASHIVIAVDAEADLLKLTIDDDGNGFNFSGSYSLEELDRLRVGPVSIKRRAHLLGANLRLESTPGHGARLLLQVPLKEPKIAPPTEAGGI